MLAVNYLTVIPETFCDLHHKLSLMIRDNPSGAQGHVGKSVCEASSSSGLFYCIDGFTSIQRGLTSRAP